MGYKLTHIKVNDSNGTITFHFDVVDKNNRDPVWRDFYDISLLTQDAPTFLNDINSPKELQTTKLSTQKFTPSESPIELSAQDMDFFLSNVVDETSTVDYQIENMHSIDKKIYPVYVKEGIHVREYTKINNKIIYPGSFIEFVYKGNKIHKDLIR